MLKWTSESECLLLFFAESMYLVREQSLDPWRGGGGGKNELRKCRLKELLTTECLVTDNVCPQKFELAVLSNVCCFALSGEKARTTRT